MAATRTLYEQLREDSQTDEPGGNTTITVLRWSIIGLATVLLTVLLPGVMAEEEQGAYDMTLLGTTWGQESIFADYSYPVPKPPAVLAAQRDSAMQNAPMVFIFDSVAADTVKDLLRKSRTGTWIVGMDQDSVYSEQIIVRWPSGMEAVIARSMITSVREAPGINKPTLVFDAAGTSLMREQMRASVATAQEIVRKGDLIVRKGQRIDEKTLQRLAAYRNAQNLRSDVTFSPFTILGSFGHAVVIISFVTLFLYFLRPVSFSSIGQLGTLVSLPVFTAFLGWLTVRLDSVMPFEYAIIIPALSMIITILYEERTALMMTLAMSIAAGAARGDDYSTMLVLFIGGTMGIYSARNVHSRTQIFTSIVAIFIGLVITAVAMDLERSSPIQWMWPKVVMATANAVVSPLLTFAIILLFERVFNVATDLRLEEFNNLNHELLRSLNERAPGTYQHTLAVARLAEAAAGAIGANVLLARVGSYFHDIGKIEKSEYFVENQIDIDNKHDKLPARRSASIIRQHVQDGIELAREYKLPERIWRFIPMHHGTVLIKHFYAKALEEAQENGSSVDEKDFRYPGPKPDSREAGIVMLADAAEALSRLVDTSQREEIAAAIDKVIIERIADGQLSDTALTMRDLDRIKEAFVKNLLGTSHQRVRYRDVQSSAASA